MHFVYFLYLHAFVHVQTSSAQWRSDLPSNPDSRRMFVLIFRPLQRLSTRAKQATRIVVLKSQNRHCRTRTWIKHLLNTLLFSQYRVNSSFGSCIDCDYVRSKCLTWIRLNWIGTVNTKITPFYTRNQTHAVAVYDGYRACKCRYTVTVSTEMCLKINFRWLFYRTVRGHCTNKQALKWIGQQEMWFIKCTKCRRNEANDAPNVTSDGRAFRARAVATRGHRAMNRRVPGTIKAMASSEIGNAPSHTEQSCRLTLMTQFSFSPPLSWYESGNNTQKQTNK